MSEKEPIKKFQEMLDTNEYISYLGVKLTELDTDHAKGRMPFAQRYANPYGSMHGGCLYSLADTISGTLADNAGCDVATVEGGMNFLEPAIETEYVYCTATMKRAGKRLITVAAEITDDRDTLIGCGLFTFFRIRHVDDGRS